MNNTNATYQRLNEDEEDTKLRVASLYYPAFILYLIRHSKACCTSLLRMSLTPVATLLTIAVIGVSMALPTGLLVLLTNAEGLIHSWKMSTKIAVFLRVGTSDKQAQQILAQLEKIPTVAKANYISPQQGLGQFQQSSGFGNVLQALPNNPLPPVIEIEPLFNQHSSMQLQALINSLQNMPYVDKAQLDIKWVKRLYAIIDLVRRGVFALGLLLALGVILVVGNTIRLMTQNQQHEIMVLQLIGASNAFIRRPFLYSGILYGAFGALIAWVLVDVILLWLHQPITDLATLYQSSFAVTNMSLSSVLMLILVGGLLGFVGAFLAVSRHIHQIRNVH